jgi:hypothetical protein
MVSEGVDIPRLAVGVYATSTATPLFFAQAVGRFLRARRRGETASVFLPSVPQLLQHAAEMEIERDHALDRVPGADDGNPFAAEDLLLAEANRGATEPGVVDELEFEAIAAEATFDRVLFDGGEFGTQAAVGSQEEADFLGLPGLLMPDQVARLLRARQSEQLASRSRRTASPGAPKESGVVREEALHRALPPLRKELNALVGAWHHRTGVPHGAIHTELRQACGGPLAAQASVAQVQQRIDTIRRWAVSRRSR